MYSVHIHASIGITYTHTIINICYSMNIYVQHRFKKSRQIDSMKYP